METPKLLNFKDNNIQELILSELKSSVKEEDYNGKPLMGMYHFDFIEKSLDVIDRAGLAYSLDPVWAAQNKDKSRPGVSVIEKYREEYGEGDVRSFLFRRIFSRILISTLEDDMTSTAVALSYNQMGYQLAFGPNVKICQNLCIMGADRFMSTYASDTKMPTPGRMLEVLGDWVGDFDSERKRDIRTIEMFENTNIPDNEVLEIIGELTTKRIRRENNNFPKEPLNPLNQGQIAQFSTNYLLKRAENDKMFNAWDIYNMATEMYKPGSTDMPILLSSNYAMSQYLKERYNLN